MGLEVGEAPLGPKEGSGVDIPCPGFHCCLCVADGSRERVRLEVEQGWRN